MSDEPTTDDEALRAHIAQRDTPRREPSAEWLRHVRAGNFSAIPRSLTWETSAELAHLINGYELANELGLGECADFANRKAKEARAAGWEGTRLELWLCLFFEHRRWRHFGYDPTGDEKRMLDELCSALAQSRG